MSRHPRFRKHIRLSNYDYKADGYYFVTICTNNRQHRFASEADQNLVLRKVHQIPKSFPGVIIDQVVIMTNHLHLILAFGSSGKPLGHVVQALKSWVTREIKGPKPVWQTNYHEHVIRNETALQKIREYIQNNPIAERIKCEQFYK